MPYLEELFDSLSEINSLFIQLDNKELHPYINKNILANFMQLAKLHATVDNKDPR